MEAEEARASARGEKERGDDEAFREGGYEPTVSHVGPPTERLLKETIAELLR